MKTFLNALLRLLRWLDPESARGAELLGLSAPVSILGGILAGVGALSGFLGAREQSRAAERASQPQPFETHEDRRPYGPAIGPLGEIPGLAQGIFEQRLQAPPPPQMRVGGPSSAFRDLVNLIQQRAVQSDFVPQAQEQALGMMSQPNPMMQQAFQGAMSFRNPFSEQLLQRGMGQGFLPRQQFSSMMGRLLGGGAPRTPTYTPNVAPLPPAPPMTQLPQLPPIQIPQGGSYASSYRF